MVLSTSTESWSNMKAQADAAFRQQNFKRARELYTEILEKHADDLDRDERRKIRGNRCLASQKQGRAVPNGKVVV